MLPCTFVFIHISTIVQFTIYFSTSVNSISVNMIAKLYIIKTVLLVASVSKSKSTAPMNSFYLKCVDPSDRTLLGKGGGGVWKSNVDPQIPTNDSFWFYEGTGTRQGSEISLRFEENVKGFLDNKNTKFYVEYWNDSPRRIVLEGATEGQAVGSSSQLTFLDGDNTQKTNGWKERIYSVVGGDWNLKLSSIMKKPETLYIRKIVVIQDPSTSARNRDKAQNLSGLLKSKTCAELKQEFEVTKPVGIISPSPAPSRGNPSSSNTPTSATVGTERGSGGGGTTGSGSTAAGTTCKTANKSTDTETCSVCPECKCVCNCNCSKC